ncbi:HK97 family phage prohead protease [Propionivibrio sp.]|uniref:HK97 family phage prohead protease n=1 Tax=Propionivibrio sp. TaxID=2212460 RepID=UPI003BF2D3C6
MLLRKTISLPDSELEIGDGNGVFSGYACKWGGVDSYGDTILPGAFTDSLRLALPKMFFNHSWGMPIGKWTTAKEDKAGLLVTGELTPDLDCAEDVYSALKHGTLDGLSIGGYMKSGDYTETETGRTIHKWSNLMEISLVVFPADANARIDLQSVKSMDFEALLPECKTERDIERLLRDAGLGKWEAMAIVSRAKVILNGRDAQKESHAKTTALILERLNKIAA